MSYVVRAVALLVLICSPVVASAAYFSVSPSSGIYSVGDIVPVKVLVTSDSTSTNSISGTLQVSPSFFSIQSVSKDGSLVKVWTSEPKISQSDGTITFEGLVLPAFKGTNGLVLTVVLKVVGSDPAVVAFTRGQILANDGNGTNITSGLDGASYTIRAVSIAPPITVTESPVDTVTGLLPVLTTLFWPLDIVLVVVVALVLLLLAHSRAYAKFTKRVKGSLKNVELIAESRTPSFSEEEFNQTVGKKLRSLKRKTKIYVEDIARE